MKKIYFTLLLLLLCTASVFSSQLYQKSCVRVEKKIVNTKAKPHHNSISDMLALPSIK